MKPIDTKTGDPWPAVYAGLAGAEIRGECCAALVERDEARGIVGGKVTTTISDPKAGDNASTKDVVDVGKSRAKHTGDELNALFASRWAAFCSEPRDLAEFIESVKTPDEAEMEAAKDAGAGIEESLKDPMGSMHAPPVGDDPGGDLEGDPDDRNDGSRGSLAGTPLE